MAERAVIDLHCDTVGEALAGKDLVAGNPAGHCDLPRFLAGSVGAQVFACFVSSEVPETHAFGRAMQMIGAVHDLCTRNPASFRLAKHAGDLEGRTPGPPVRILLGVENGHAIESDLGKLRRLREAQVRVLTLTHSKNLSWAASSGEASCAFEGLTDFGEKVVEAMNDLGIVVDVSHVHDTTFWDVIRITRKPIVASHSNARALCDSARNLDDDQIRAIADNGGMIGVNFFPGFLDAEYAADLKRHCSDLFAELDRIERQYMDDPVGKSAALGDFARVLQGRMAAHPVPVARIVDHVDHIVGLVGTDYVGFGSDFDGIPSLPQGVHGCDVYPALLAEMERRGYGEAEIEKIAWGNFLRVLAAHDVP